MIAIKNHLRDINRVNLDTFERGEYLRLDKNEGLIPPTKQVIQSVIENQTTTIYPEYGQLKNKLAKHVNLSYENICIGNGSDAIIKNIFETYINPGDGILLTDPTFAMYPIYCQMFQAKYLPLIKYNSLTSFPKKRFLEGLDGNIKMAVIINPNNPTGHAVDRAFLINAINKSCSNDILMIVDEAYHYYYPETVVDLVSKYENLIVLRTFSKFFGLASLRVGYGIACPKIIENLRKVQLTFDLNGVAVDFVNRIVDDKEYIDRVSKEYNDGKKYILSKLEENRVEYHKTEANFVLIDCSKSVEKIKSELYKRKILVSAGFKQSILKKYIRVTIGSKKHMEHFWKEFIDIYGGLE